MAEECCGCFIERSWLLFIEPLRRPSATGERQSRLFRRWKWWFSVDGASWECEKRHGALLLPEIRIENLHEYLPSLLMVKKKQFEDTIGIWKL